MHIPLGKRKGNVVGPKSIPDINLDGAAHVGDAIFRVVDPDP